MHGTSSNNEDSGAATGWSIADSYLVESDSNWVSDASNSSTEIAIKGTVYNPITGAAVTSTPSRSHDTYGAGEKIRFTVTFNDAVDVTGSPKLPIVVLTKNRYATYESGSGTSELVFAYTVREGDRDNNGVLAPPNHRRTYIKLTGGDAIRTSGTNDDAILSTIDISGPSHRVVGAAAWVGDSFVSNLGRTADSTSASATTTTRTAIAQGFTTRGAGTLRAVRIDGSFGSITTVTIFSADEALGTPGTNLGVLQNPDTLHATAQVQEFRAAPAGMALAANTSYYVVVVAGVNAAVKLTNHDGEDGAWGWTLANDYHAQASSSWSQQANALKLALLGTSTTAPPAAPRITGKPVVGTPGRDCAWTPGETVAVTLTFSEAVTIDDANIKATPTLKLQLGFQDDRTANYAAGSGTTELLFQYMIAAGDGKNLSINVPRNGLRLNGAAIESTSTGADARITHDHGNFGARPKGKCALPGGREFLVGNLSQGDEVTYHIGSGGILVPKIAQAFTPGAVGATLRRVVLPGEFTTSTQVSVYSDSAGFPGTSLATLENPGRLTSTLSDRGNYTFSAGAGGLALSAGTPYWVLVEGTGTWLGTTQANDVGRSGWSMGDESGVFDGTWFLNASGAGKMAVYGVLSEPMAPPTIVGAPFIPTPPPCYQCAGLWKPGRGVEVRLTFSEPVTVKYRRHYRNKPSEDTKPTLDIYLGGEVRRTVKYARGSGTRTVTFVYWVTAADGSYNSMSVAPNSLKLNGGKSTARRAASPPTSPMRGWGTLTRSSSATCRGVTTTPTRSGSQAENSGSRSRPVAPRPRSAGW